MHLQSASGHVYWSYVPDAPLLQHIDWMDPALVIVTNGSVFMNGLWGHNRLIHSPGEDIAFVLSLGFKSFPIFIEHLYSY